MLGLIIRSVNYHPRDVAIRSERNFTLTAKRDAGQLELTVEASQSNPRRGSSDSSSSSQSESSSEISESSDDSNEKSGEEDNEENLY
jgi:hypothetical protein